FSTFSATQFPSAGYAFHSYLDGGGALRDPVVLKAGDTNYFRSDHGINRWGDWSASGIDPLNDLDLWTLQAYAAPRLTGTNRWGTWWGRVSPLTDLSMAASGSPGTVGAGSNVTYTVRITNMLETVATGVRVVDTLPVNAVFVSAVPSQGACAHTNGVVTC